MIATTLSSSHILIRGASPSDMPCVAQLHRAAYGDIQGSLTAGFSRQLLEEYYAALLECNPYSYIAFDATEHPIGFVFAGFNTNAALRYFVRKHKLALTKALLLTPGALGLTVARLLRQDKVKSKVPLRLLSIAIEPSYRHRGAGKAVLTVFEEQLRDHGFHQYGLSVKASNIRAIEFYNRNGFALEFETPAAHFYTKSLRGLPTKP
jgi:ribosomal protein S18 acetylase RimI-like enzyme